MADKVKQALPKILGFQHCHVEIKNKYPIGGDLESIDDVRFIKSLDVQKDKHLFDPDVALAMLSSGVDVKNKRTWMVLDKEVLTFDVYCKSTVYESEGPFRYNVRKLKLIYFLLDGTFQVNEPIESNSGMPQGCFLKRQMLPLPGGDPKLGPHYKLIDLVVGKTVEIYGRVLKITGVDCYTRRFLVKMGIDVPENELPPDDPYYVFRKQTHLDVAPKSKSIAVRTPPHNGLDGKVLRFRGYWDDRQAYAGHMRFFDVLFYLEDDTMELVEVFPLIERNGDGAPKMAIRRQKLQKAGPWCSLPGHDTKQEMLNVFLNKWKQPYYQMDCRLMESAITEYYQCTDLYIGATINVFNRTIVLIDCDPLTEQFYRQVYGLGSFKDIEAPKTWVQLAYDEYEALETATILQSQDEMTRKAMLKTGGKDTMFLFRAQIVSDDPITRGRKFMFKYYLDDNSFALYEIKETNSGFYGGSYRSRRGQDQSKGDESFVFHHLKVGHVLTLGGVRFTLVDTDDKTLEFMINRPREFPHSNVSELTAKVRRAIDQRFQSLDDFRRQGFGDSKLVGRQQFRKTISFDGELDDHGPVVLAYVHKRRDTYEPVMDRVFRSSIQDLLKRAGFMHFDGLLINLESRRSAADRDGRMNLEEAMKALDSNNLPLPKNILAVLKNRFIDREDCSFKYMDMMRFIDYTLYSVEAPNGMAREVLFIKPNEVKVKVDDFVDSLRNS